ncbi:hypothetical protein ACHAWO_002545 [Cyclotella atomus]|uniref:J domain-containing protein n=1 Tax=Cyclotella atomus TaxID=382360 RepID=A0ABD3NI59_9STRA
MTFLSKSGEPLQNPYEILGLERGAGDDDVNKAFRKLMLKLHPDKQPAGQSEEEAAEVAATFHNVMSAKSFLLDADHMTAKRSYDSKLASLDRQKHKFVIPPFDKKCAQTSGRDSSNKPKRRGLDCTNDRGPNLFKKTGKNRRASLDDCSTASQSSSGDDVPRRNKSNSPSRRSEKLNSDKKSRSHVQTESTKPSRHQRNGSNIPKTCKKASSFSESCCAFFTHKGPKKVDVKRDKKSGDINRPSRATISEKPPSPSQHAKSRMSIPSAPSQSASPGAHLEAKQRITNSIDTILFKFKCPLTKEIINDPMTDFEGNSYERDAILKYLGTHSNSPVTGAPLYACHLTANATLKEKIRCTMELKKTLDTLAQKKELKRVTKQHTPQHTAPTKSLRESINSFITELNSGTPVISLPNLDDKGISSFSYLGIKFKLEVSEVNSFSSFSVQTLFDHDKKAASISARLVDWNKAFQEVGLGGKLIFKKVGGTFTFSLNKSMKPEEFKSRTFRYSVEYFLEFALKLHNIINVNDLKTVGKVRLSA